jgi:Asp-tRNA(Asn)/Glu-tRNA(Gln) amidotransferase A subunit family amidase
MLNVCHRWGLIAYADTLDTVGIMASDVESVEKVYGESSQSRASSQNARADT